MVRDDDVLLQVPVRGVPAEADVGVRCQVDDGIGAPEELGQLRAGLEQIEGDELEARLSHGALDEALAAGGEVVDAHDGVPGRQKGIRGAGSDETGSAGDDDPHDFITSSNRTPSMRRSV